MSNDAFEVTVVQLQDTQGARYKWSVNSVQVQDQENPVPFLAGEPHTIRSLKKKINSLYFGNDRWPIGRIIVFSPPTTASTGSPQPWVNHTALVEPLEAGKLYGFLDMTTTRAQEPQQSQPRTETHMQILNLTNRILELEMLESRAISYADYYHEKKSQERIRSWLPASGSASERLPTALRGRLPQGGEKEIIKPFWKSMLETNQLVSTFSNGYEVGKLGLNEPDVAFYPCTVVKPTDGEFVAFGDCKGSKWTGTSSAELGQVMQYSHRILDAQPQRSHVYGFITNNAHVVLIRAERANKRPFGVWWNISTALTFEHGMKTFFRLLEHDHGFVDPPTVQGSPLVIRRALRPGGTCRAFEAVHREIKVVAKLYADSSKAQVDASKIRKVRLAINGTASSVSTYGQLRAEIPTVLAVEENWLLLSPLGRSFTAKSFRLHHLKMLLELLKSTHEANIIHWDVRFANIFWLPDTDQVLLNDWGASTAGGVSQLVQGCPQPFCHPDLVDAADVVPEPKHDLYSLVASIAYLLGPGWSGRGYQHTLINVFRAVEQVDYDGVWQELEVVGLD